jgi:sugar phosphate isomerase/epimerase
VIDMSRKIELLASFWTIAGDCYPMGPSEIATFPLRDRVEAAAEAGYTGMGFAHQDLMHNASLIGWRGIKRLLDDHGIIHVEVEFLGDWFETGQKRVASDRVRKELLEAAHSLGARDMKVAGKMWSEECDVNLMADAFGEVCVEARAANTNVAIEILPVTNIRTLETGLAIVTQADQPNGGLCLDVWHFARGGINFDKLRRVPTRYVKSVEIDDAAIELKGSVWEDTLFHRLYPGEGSFDIPSFIDAIGATEFNGAYGVEIISESKRKLPLKQQAKQSFEAAMNQFR